MRKNGITYRQLCKALLPAAAILTSLAITVSIGMWSNSDTLNELYGRGKRTVISLSGAEELKTNYYPQLYSDTVQSRAAAYELSKKISDEGIVLLKNDGLLPLPADTHLSPMGLRYQLPFYGGSGSCAIDISEQYIVTPSEGLHRAFLNVSAELEECIARALAKETQLSNNPGVIASRPLTGGMDGHTLYELDASVYTAALKNAEDSVAVVFIGRQTGEHLDASTLPYDDGAAHMLTLSAAERDTIRLAKARCRDVVVILASSTPMEIAELEHDSGIGAIVWVGGAGASGYDSLGDILSGNVVPSGRTTDIYPANFKNDPAFPNQDDGTDSFVYSNAFTTMVSNFSVQESAGAPFREYEEGVYLGYRYYETAFSLGHLSKYYNPTDGVVYPFGYGLSYTEFSQEIVSLDDSGDEIIMTVRVTNTGTEYSGKDVVQIYYSPPYTDFDVKNLIEKPAASLIQFEKTDVLDPGGWEDVSISFLKEDMASFCYTRSNGDGTTGCYVLEKGQYWVSLRADSHRVIDKRAVDIPDTVWYDNETPRLSEREAGQEADDARSAAQPSSAGAATSRFEQLNMYMNDTSVSGASVLSRGDWLNTQPTAPGSSDRIASDTVIRWIEEADSTRFDYKSDKLLGNVRGSLVYSEDTPVTGADNGLVLANLRGKPYDDPMWELLLDQLDLNSLEEIRRCLFENAYKSGEVKSIGKPESAEHDGPQGLAMTDLSGRNWIEGTCGYPSVPVMASAWSRELMYEFGYMVGQEALLLGINGLYAPGLNIHRSPFGGRNGEYFSEDPVLSGQLGAQIISGGGDAGIYCAVKHFVLMDTENHRSPHSTVWLTEQALREIYMKPFEIALKTARKTIYFVDGRDGALQSKTMSAGDFLMTSDCAVGPCWSAANYALLTEVVRGEWGFTGFIISDMQLNSNGNQADKILRSGCDGLMSTDSGTRPIAGDTASATGLQLLRRSVKNICYPLVNSNLMQNAAPGSIIKYSAAPWRIWLFAADAVVLLLDIAVCCLIVIKRREA